MDDKEEEEQDSEEEEKERKKKQGEMNSPPIEALGTPLPSDEVKKLRVKMTLWLENRGSSETCLDNQQVIQIG